MNHKFRKNSAKIPREAFQGSERIQPPLVCLNQETWEDKQLALHLLVRKKQNVPHVTIPLGQNASSRGRQKTEYHEK